MYANLEEGSRNTRGMLCFHCTILHNLAKVVRMSEHLREAVVIGPMKSMPIRYHGDTSCIGWSSGAALVTFLPVLWHASHVQPYGIYNQNTINAYTLVLHPTYKMVNIFYNTCPRKSFSIFLLPMCPDVSQVLLRG